MSLLKYLPLLLITISYGALADPRCGPDELDQEFCDATMAEKEKIAADNQLNSLYKEVAKRLSKDDRATLVKAQRAWVTYFELQCNMSTYFYGASAASHEYILNTCLKDKIKQRIKELEGFCPEENCNISNPSFKRDALKRAP